MDTILVPLLVIAIVIIIKLLCKINDLNGTISWHEDQNFQADHRHQEVMKTALSEQKSKLEAKHKAELTAQKVELEKRFRMSSKSGHSAYTYQSKIEALEKEITSLNDRIEFLSTLAKDGDSLDRLYTENKEFAQKILDLETQITRLTQEKDQEIQKIKSDAETAAQRKQIKYEREIKRFKEAAETAYGKGKASAMKNLSNLNATPSTITTPRQTASFDFIWNAMNMQLYNNGIQTGRLKTALDEMEQIKSRFVGDIKFIDQKFPNAQVEIVPSSPKATKNYIATLTQCSCKDYETTKKQGKAACKHMFTLALELGIISTSGSPTSPITIQK